MEVLFEGRSVPVSILMDDSIDTVRQRLGAALGRHPDKLFFEVEVELSKDAQENPRDWEAVFFRLAQTSNAQSTQGELMKAQTQEKRSPAPPMETGVPREDWDSLRALRFPETSFREKRILGVEMPQSLVLPVPPNPSVAVPSARIPLPQRSRMLKSLHPEKIVRFHATEITAPENSQVRMTQAPYWTPATPDKLPEEVLRNLAASLETIRKLKALPVEKPVAVRLTRVRWQVPWIQTDWGVAVRNRFEQIFFGMTVSDKVPYIGLFTNREHGMQHKFQVPDPSTQKPQIKIADWMNWVQTTRPQRDRPTLLLYRGTDRTNFERIAITATTLTLNIYRSGQQSTSLEAFQKSMEDWISQLDAVLAFAVPADLKPRRWELMEVSADVSQADAITELDTRRLPCLSTVFLGKDSNQRLLRSDKTDRSLSDLEIAVIRRLRDNENLNNTDVSEELRIPIEDATRILADVTERLQEDPSLKTEDLDVMPKLEIMSKKIRISHAEDLERLVDYANILRQVLTGSGAELDAVCPPRSDVMPSEAVLVAVAPEIAPEIAPEDPDLDDAFDFMGAARPKKIPKDPGAGQILNRLRTLDPDTFDDSYSRKCELKRQPILMTDDDVAKARIKGQDIEEEYPANRRVRILSGTVICPEQWCMIDRIPLRQDQLVDEQCPECGGDLRKDDSELSIKEAPVLVRNAAFKYPGYLDKVSAKNQQAVPCCFMTPQNTTLAPTAGPTQAMDAFYIMRETARGIPEKRLAYLSEELAGRLRISVESQTKTRKENNRLKDKVQSVFRVGLGRPAKTLGDMLKLNVPRPRDNVEALFECPFVKTWRKPAEDDGHFSKALEKQIPNAESRARMGRLLAGVDAAQEGGRLTPLQEVEYFSQATKTQVFRVNLTDFTMTCGFGMDLFRGGQRAICILETENTVDILAQALHNRKSVDWTVNLQQSPFTKATTRVLETTSADACGRSVPGLGDAIHAAVTLGGATSFVVDPLGQAQAVQSPGRWILPIQPDSPPAPNSQKVDYSDIPLEQLPSQESEREALGTAASESHPGFAWKRDHQDLEGRRVEIETVSGFRAPVRPEEVSGEHPVDEVLATIRQGREEDLVSGLPNPDDSQKATEISQESEVLDQLIYVLARDLQDEDQAELREAVEEVDADVLEEPLHEWQNSQIGLVDFTKPTEFVRKVRMPCPRYTEADCKGICGWTNKGTCRVRADHRKKDDKGRPLLFVRLLKTLVENDKQRAVVLDGRASPFFGRILYLQLPHERFMTDSQIKWEKTQVAE